MARRRRRPRDTVRVRMRFSRGVEAYYRGQLVAVVRRVRASVEGPLVELARKYAQEPDDVQDSAAHDAAIPRTKTARRLEQERTMLRTLERLAGGIERTVPRTVAQHLAGEVAKRAARMVTQTLIAAIVRSVGVDVSSAFAMSELRGVIDKATADNVALITSLPTGYRENLATRLQQGFAAGQRWETLAKEIERSGEVTESRAKLIARDQSSKMTAAVNQARQQELGGDEYEWSTSNDELVRESHAAHEGQRFRWDTPPPDTGNPGDDVNCRCTAVAVFRLDRLAGFPKAAVDW